jgi:D-alanine-D-alanine ligase
VVSAEHVIAAADASRFAIVPIGVTKEGVWLSAKETQAILDAPSAPFKKRVEVKGPSSTSPSAPGPLSARGEGDEGRRLGAISEALARVDVAFPLIHGTHGEDGTLQGLLEIADVPYVGCGVAASAVGMDKALMKALFREAGLPVSQYAIVQAAVSDDSALIAGARDLESRLGYPMFVKPANGGSSVGVSKVSNREGLVAAILEAGRRDRKVVVEKALSGREVECGILGNADAEASGVGEIRHKREFYDYEAKYVDPSTEVIVPADLPEETVARIRELSLRAFRAIDGAGMARVDFFLCPDGSLVVEEINTIPGFTPGSMYPRLWQARGVNYGQLITRLVDLALARHEEKPVV